MGVSQERRGSANKISTSGSRRGARGCGSKPPRRGCKWLHGYIINGSLACDSKKRRRTSNVHNLFHKSRLDFRIIVHGILVVARGFLQFNCGEENPRLSVSVFDVRFIPVNFSSILWRSWYVSMNEGRRSMVIRSWSA